MYNAGFPASKFYSVENAFLPFQTKISSFLLFRRSKNGFSATSIFPIYKNWIFPFKNFKNVIRRSEIVESCYFYEKIKKQTSEDFLVTQKSGFYKFSDNPGHKYLRLVHILNEFCFHHKQSKGISNDIQSS